MNANTNQPHPIMNVEGPTWDKYLAAYDRLIHSTTEAEKQAAEKDVISLRTQIALPFIIEGAK